MLVMRGCIPLLAAIESNGEFSGTRVDFLKEGHEEDGTEYVQQ